MLSQYDLVEELTYMAQKADYIHKGDLQLFHGRVISISGTYFLSKILSKVNAGDLLTGYGMLSIKEQILAMKIAFETAGVRFKLVFNSNKLFTERQYFAHHCQVKKRFYHLLWKLEVMKCLSTAKEDSSESRQLVHAINTAKRVVNQSQFFKHFLEQEVMENVLDYLHDLKIEFIVATGPANNQLVWLYSYDYCEAILGDLSLLPFSETVPQIITDIDFDGKTFSYINMKDLSEGLKLVKGKEKRQAELWSFTIAHEHLVDTDLTVLVVLEENIRDMEAKHKHLLKERSEKVKDCIGKINLVMNQLDTGISNTEKSFAELFNKITEGKFPRREANIMRIDSGQVIQSSCEYTFFPNVKSSNMNEQEKQKFRSQNQIEFTNSKKLNSFMTFDIFNPQFLLLTTKASKYHIYFQPPASDSKEYRTLLEKVVPRELEVAFGNFLSAFGKLCLINDYAMEAYCSKDPVPLNVKDHFTSLESGEKVLYYFKEAAFNRFEKDNGSYAAKQGQGGNKISFKNLTAMVFQAFSSATDSSPLTVSQFVAKKAVSVDPPLTQKEVVGFVLLNLLDDLEFINIKHKKFMILGAGLMRKGSDVLEEKLILLLELIKLNMMSGEFMNPPDMTLLRSQKKRDDKYLFASLRKTSEEIRTKGRTLAPRDEDGDLATMQKRKESEFLLKFDEGLSRDPTIYDYEKIVNVINMTINKYKESYISIATANKQLSDETIDLFVNGIHSKSVLKIVTISRVFCLIDCEMKFLGKGNYTYIEDFDTSQFLSILGLTQRLLRFRIDGFFSVALNLGAKNMLLKEIEDTKAALPFRTAFNSHLSNLVKIILTQYTIIQQASQASPNSEFLKSVKRDFTLAALEKAYPGYNNMKDALLAGYHLLLNLVKILEYGTERGIDKQSSPVIQLWLDCRDLLKDCFGSLGVVDSLPKA